VGLFAVFACGQQNLRCVVIDALDQPGGQCRSLYPDKPIYDIPSRQAVTGKDLIDELMAQAAPYQPDIQLQVHVISIAPDAVNGWLVATNDGRSIGCRVVFIAGGNGLFQPVRPQLPGIDAFEGKSIFYAVGGMDRLAGKRIVVAGGGDSALDWAVMLSNVASKLYLVHRRPRFRGAPATAAALQDLVKNQQVELLAPCQLSGVLGEAGMLTAVKVQPVGGNERILDADILLPCYGMKTNLGPLSEWDLEMSDGKIVVDPASCTTSRPGIFAIGDIAVYPGKLGLILTGFAEAAAAAHAAFAYIHPEIKRHFEHSTTRGQPAVSLT